MSTKYDLRSDPGVEKNYGKLLLEMVSVVPDGIVCFFVSYSYMDGIVNSWHETGLLKVICYSDIFPKLQMEHIISFEPITALIPFRLYFMDMMKAWYFFLFFISFPFILNVF